MSDPSEISATDLAKELNIESDALRKWLSRNYHDHRTQAPRQAGGYSVLISAEAAQAARKHYLPRSTRAVVSEPEHTKPSPTPSARTRSSTDALRDAIGDIVREEVRKLFGQAVGVVEQARSVAIPTKSYAVAMVSLGRRDGFSCRICGSTAPDLQIDHIKPQAQGGTDDPSNLQLLCARCNASKQANWSTSHE